MTWVKIIIGLSAAALIIASVLQFKKFSFAKWIWLGGLILNVAVVLINWITNGYVPFISVYQVLAFLGACFPLIYLYLCKVLRVNLGLEIFALCEAVCMIGCVFMDASPMYRVPALQSPFFFPHILCYMLAYSLCAVGFVLTIIYLCRKQNEVKIATEKTMYSVLLTAFPFMVAGMFLGAIWANECWGTYWAWDAKETWSLVTTCMYALYFHCRKHKSLKIFNGAILIVAFVCMIMTFIGVNLFSSDSVHSYS